MESLTTTKDEMQRTTNRNTNLLQFLRREPMQSERYRQKFQQELRLTLLILSEARMGLF